MKCKKCGTDVKDGWKFCPKCGFGQGSPNGMFNIENIFERMQQDMKNMEKNHSRDPDNEMEVFDLGDIFRNMRVEPMKGVKRGFTIKITTGTGVQPKVDVKTFGDVSSERIKGDESEMYPGLEIKPREPANSQKKDRLGFLKKVKVTEEPKTELRRIDTGIVVDIELPEVKGMNDIDVNDLPSSVEVKAIAGNKAYFKIITKPAQLSITKKEFRDGVLRIEFS